MEGLRPDAGICSLKISLSSCGTTILTTRPVKALLTGIVRGNKRNGKKLPLATGGKK